MDASSDKPLITLVVCAYRQEHFIREAVASALAQTYSPLEIILSDDCSPDHTFEIMQEMAAAYRGPHRVKLNRNPTNLRVPNHVNRFVELAQGELVVGCAGDDISVPERTAKIVQHWLREGRRPHSVYSNSQVINSAGKPMFIRLAPGDEWHAESVTQAAKRMGVAVSGATLAFSREVFAKFGPLPEDCFFEDEIIGFRSLMLGPVAYLPQPLVLYREHPQSTFKRTKDAAVNLAVQSLILTWLRDLEKGRELDLVTAETVAECRTYLRDHLEYLRLEADIRHESVATSLGSAASALRRGARPELILKALYRCHTPTPIRNLRKMIGSDLFRPQRIAKLIRSRLG